jgi:hypothetical protein
MGKLILRPDTQEVLHRPDLTEDAEGYEGAVFLDVPVDFTLKEKRIDWDTMTVVDDVQAVRDRRWEEAKAYRALRQSEPLPIPGIVAGDTIVAQRDTEGQAWIDRFVAIATAAIVSGEAFEITFGDFTNRPFTVNALQILKIGAASMAQQALCKAKSEAVRVALDAALAAPGATAAQIEAIEITAGYPTLEDAGE